MAKVTGMLPKNQIPAEMQAMTFSFTTKGQGHARFLAKNAHQTSEFLAQFHPRLREAAAAWEGLSSWKRARWTKCAQQSNKTGFGLYLEQYLAQDVPPPVWENIETLNPDGTITPSIIWRQRHPISPCSRRATDPNASPWDYTP